MSQLKPKYRSKNAVSLPIIVSFLAACPPPSENLETGGMILVIATPTEGVAPSRNALSMKPCVAVESFRHD